MQGVPKYKDTSIRITALQGKETFLRFHTKVSQRISSASLRFFTRAWTNANADRGPPSFELQKIGHLQPQVAQILGRVNVLLVERLAVEQRGQSRHKSVDGVDVGQQAAQLGLQLLVLEQLDR